MLEVVGIIDTLQPDVIVITGDFVNHDDEELDLILPALNTLSAPLGVYGCLGNHDHYANTPAVIQRLKHTPVDLLVNRHATLEVDGSKLHLIGTDNTGFSQNYADLPKAIDGMNPRSDDVQILLAHDPTFWDGHVRPSYPDIDLMLCGHTHGGQVGFEMGPLRWSLARIAYPRWAGLYQESRPQNDCDQYLYVNRGLGTVGPPIRFGVRPEITLLTLRKA
jgi:predicted MPP superfamily phosphohydrolase